MRVPLRATMLALPALLLALACGGDVTSPGADDVTYAPELGINLSQMTRTASGLYYQDVTVGDGTAATSGRGVLVLYRGWLSNGTLFDERQDPDDPIGFTLGIGEVIRGWDEGLVGMREGGTRKLVIPPALAYGDQRNGPIPANSVLVFEVTLLDVQ
jgi:FKBP-type peptidyl-prolyl cis-trans isomerase FkpA